MTSTIAKNNQKMTLQQQQQQQRVKPTSIEFINFVETPFGYKRSTVKQGCGSKKNLAKSTHLLASSNTNNIILTRTASNGRVIDKSSGTGTSNFDEEDGGGGGDVCDQLG